MVSDVSGYTGNLSHVTFKLYNTATHGIETFKPLREGQVSIYHCGMTVQSSPHPVSYTHLTLPTNREV